MEVMEVNKSFWNRKRVLVTGDTGFKGSWLCLWLESMGAIVHGAALPPPTSPSLYQIAQVGQLCDHTDIDVRSSADVANLFSRFSPDVVFHLAAQPLVRASYQSPIDTLATNVMGTANVLEASRYCGSLQGIVVVTTDKCYQNHGGIWGYREDDPMGGDDPYSCSKGCAELVSNAYRASYLKDAGIGVATARAGNVIGGGDWAIDRLVPDILRSLENDKLVRIRYPSAIRPWQHVLEPLCGYILLAERLCQQGSSYSDSWNFGPSDDDARPVQWIVEKLCQKWSGESTWILDVGNHPHESETLRLDTAKARYQLGWKPRWTLDQSLDMIVAWHKSFHHGDDMQALCKAQISEYECAGL
jgi:CDP-glucose 4,6-dehydratase